MSPTRVEIEDRVRRTLRAYADRVEPALPTFVASPVAPDSQPRSIATRPRSGPRIAAAAIAVALVVVLALVIARPGGDDAKPSRVATAPGPAEPAAIGVRGIPTDMQLWSMSVESSSGSGAAMTQQLISLDGSGSPAGPLMLVTVQHASPGAGVRPGGPVDATVRGQDVTVDAAKDAPADASEFGWVEGDGVFEVIVRRAPTARAVDVLDALRLRAAASDGFELAALPDGVTSLGERAATDDLAPNTQAAFVYGHDVPVPGQDAELGVWTSTNLGYPGYFRTLLSGEPLGADGALSFDKDIGAIAAWKDGRQVVVGPPSLGEQALRAVAASGLLLHPNDATALRAALDRRLAALPLLGSSTRQGLTLDLVGPPSSAKGAGPPAAVCLRGEQPRCSAPVPHPYTIRTDQLVVVSTDVDGRWLAAALGVGDLQLTFSRSGGAAVPTTGFTRGGVGSGRYTFAWIDGVPAGLDDLGLTPDGESFQTLLRPAGTG